jgi:two-component system response regulator DegU
MDVNMPEMNGIEATRRIGELMPEIRVIGLSMHDNPSTVAALREAGAAGYVAKGGSPEELWAAIRNQPLSPD